MPSGLLGEDRSAEFTTDKIMAMEVHYDAEARKAYQGGVEGERAGEARPARDSELAALAGEHSDDQGAGRGRHQGLRPDQRTLRPCEGIPGLRAQHRRRQVRRPPARRPVLPGRLRRGRQPRRRSSARSTTATPCSSRRSAAARRRSWRRPASIPSTSTPASSSRNRRSAGSEAISSASAAARFNIGARGDADIRQGAFIAA